MDSKLLRKLKQKKSHSSEGKASNFTVKNFIEGKARDRGSSPSHNQFADADAIAGAYIRWKQRTELQKR